MTPIPLAYWKTVAAGEMVFRLVLKPLRPCLIGDIEHSETHEREVAPGITLLGPVGTRHMDLVPLLIQVDLALVGPATDAPLAPFVVYVDGQPLRTVKEILGAVVK